MTDEQRWDEFISWGRRFYTWPEFEAEERAYKLAVAARLRAVHDTLNDGTGTWLGWLREAFKAPNNLVYWTVKAAFPAWCEAHPTQARQALSHLWEGAGSYRERINRFAAEVDKQAVGGMYGMFASFLLMALDPTAHLTLPRFRGVSEVSGPILHEETGGKRYGRGPTRAPRAAGTPLLHP
jgi:hypothetical protein